MFSDDAVFVPTITYVRPGVLSPTNFYADGVQLLLRVGLGFVPNYMHSNHLSNYLIIFAGFGTLCSQMILYIL